VRYLISLIVGGAITFGLIAGITKEAGPGIVAAIGFLFLASVMMLTGNISEQEHRISVLALVAFVVVLAVSVFLTGLTG